MDNGWVNQETTPDQLEIERFLENQEPGDVLHIGIGNSSLAAHFPDWKVDGITISESEVSHAQDKNLPKYKAILANKHDPDLPDKLSTYDYIVDNNLFSYTSTHKDKNVLVGNIARMLKPKGKLLGGAMGWEYSIANRDCLMDSGELQESLATHGVETNYYKVGRVLVFERV